MSSSFDPAGLDADLALDVFAAQLRLEHQDAHAQAERIAQRLSQLVPHLVTRSEKSAWPFGRPAQTQLRIDLGPEHFELTIQPRHVQYRVIHHAQGIDLSHQELTQGEWIRRLMDALAQHAATTSTDASALL